jgi:uncharacterized protein YukE
MIGDLAHVGRVFGDVVSQRADLQAARNTLSKVSAAVDAVRLAWEGEAAENVIAALDAIDRALRGVPAPASEARQCEACTAANGTATFHAPEEPCDPGADEHAVRRLSVEIEALQTTVLRQQEAIEAMTTRTENLSSQVAAWGRLTNTLARAQQTTANTVESISVHAEALDQRVAGIGNGLDEVRDPSWIRKAIARAVEESGGR